MPVDVQQFHFYVSVPHTVVGVTYRYVSHLFISLSVSSSIHTFRRLLKTHCFQQAFGSPKCLRFGHWLTPCTLKIDLLTFYLLTYIVNTIY